MQAMIVGSGKLYQGDAAQVLRSLPPESVDCIVTSPPYYGLRDYGVGGQIGLEDTPEQYIDRLMDVFDAVSRVLKPSGTLWLNIADSYAGSGRGVGQVNVKGIQPKASFATKQFNKPYRGLGCKNKDLIGIPWMLAFALRNAGWYLRQEIIWHKPNPMPESVRDRCTKSHESIFLLSKSPRYYFDHYAIMEPAKYDGRKDTVAKGSPKYAEALVGQRTQSFAQRSHERWPNSIRGYVEKGNETGLSAQHHGNNIQTYPARNKRDVWTIPTRAFKGAHFATFPTALITNCIKAGCPTNGVVLDPFFGAGTTGLVAEQLERQWVGIELNPKYCDLAKSRIEQCIKFHPNTA